MIRAKHFLILFSIFYLLSSAISTSAQTIPKSNYNVDFSLGIPTKTDLSTPSNNAISRSPLPSGSLTFSIQETAVDFGLLSPTNPITRETTLTVDNDSNNGYVVYAFENHPLTTTNLSVIPDTTCDAGICNQTIGALWSSILSYGFGYRCESKIMTPCDESMLNKTFYKQFSDNSNEENPEAVMTSTNPLSLEKSQIIYKVNVPGTQQEGLYSNTITYIAVPNF